LRVIENAVTGKRSEQGSNHFDLTGLQNAREGDDQIFARYFQFPGNTRHNLRIKRVKGVEHDRTIDSAGCGQTGHVELCGHQNDRIGLIDAANRHCRSGKKLIARLEVMRKITRFMQCSPVANLIGAIALANAVAKDIVGVCGFPQFPPGGERAVHSCLKLRAQSPFLIRIHHRNKIIANYPHG